MEQTIEMMRNCHVWKDYSLIKEDIRYMFFDPVAGREYTVNIHMIIGVALLRGTDL